MDCFYQVLFIFLSHNQIDKQDMHTNNKKRPILKKVGIAIAVVSIFIGVWGAFFWTISFRQIATIQPFCAKMDTDTAIYIDNGTHYMLFDTGWGMSSLFDSLPAGSVPYGLISTHSADKKPNIRVSYTKGSAEFGSVKVTPCTFLYHPQGSFRLMQEEMKDKQYIVLGTSWILGSNWVLDFKEGMIHCLKQDNRPEWVDLLEPSLVLKYRCAPPKYRMLTDLNINGIDIKDILIDTGSSYMISLDQESFKETGFDEKGYKTMGKSATSEGIYEFPMYRYPALRVSLNYKPFESINFTCNTKHEHKSIGSGFLRTFERVFIDTKREEIYCFKKIVQ